MDTVETTTPRPHQENAAPRPVGESVTRLDAHEKVTGEAVFADDLQFGPNMLYARIKRSPHPHARILKIDASQALALPGVKTVVTGQSTPGFIGLYLKDRHIFCTDRARFVGDPVAGVAAVTEEIAERALDLIHVEYEVLPPVLDPEDGVRPDAELLHPELGSYEVANFIFPQPGTNIPNLFKIRKGDVDQALSEAAAVVHHTFRVPHVQHVPIEPHVAIAKVDERGRVTLWGSSQSPFAQRNLIASALGISQADLEVVAPVRGRRLRLQGRGQHGSPGGGHRHAGSRPSGQAAPDPRGRSSTPLSCGRAWWPISRWPATPRANLDGHGQQVLLGWRGLRRVWGQQ